MTQSLPREDRLTLFEALPPEQGAAVLSELRGETLRLVLHRASPAKLGAELDRLARVVALSFFIPLLIGTGGNSGSQTVTTIVRGLAVGEIRIRDFGRVILREGGSGVRSA